MMLKARDVVVEPLGRDAIKGPLITAAAKPVLTVVFVGVEQGIILAMA